MQQRLPALSAFLPTAARWAVLLFSGFCALLFIGSSAQAQPLTISASSSTACSGATVTLTATGCPTNGTLRWSTNQAGAVIAVAPVQTSSYVVSCNVTTGTSTTVTSATGVSSTAVVTNVTTTTATTTIQVNPAIVVTPAITNATCAGNTDGSVTINATGGTGALQYQFNGQGFQAITSFQKLPAGSYPIVVRDAIGCTNQSTVVIRESAPLSLSITAVAAKCIGGSDGGIVAAATGGAGEYLYYLNNANPRSSGTFLDLPANTTYLVAVTDKQGCVTAKEVTVGAPTPFNITATPTLTRCPTSADGSVSVSVTGGNSSAYQYRIGARAFQTGPQFTGLAAGTYEITVQDAIGCQGKQTVTVAAPAPLQLSTTTVPVNCAGPNSGVVTITPTGGTGTVRYQLTAGTPQTSNVFAGVAAGTYTVIGTDVNGCTSFTSVTVGRSEPLKLQAIAAPATCCVCPTGSVRLASTGGTGTRRQYQLLGQAVQTEAQIGGLRPNTYSIRVVDEVGCTDSTTFVVTDAASLSLATGAVKNVSCTGGSNGEATVVVSGGNGPFTYYWLTERKDTLKTFTATQTALVEGTYTVSVLDNNRCTTPTTFVTVRADNPVPFKPTVSQAGSTLSVDQSAGIQWYVRTGTEAGQPIQNATQPTLMPMQSGQFYVVVSINGCSSPASNAISFVLTALSEPGSGLSLRVAPNPVRDQLRLEIVQPERSAVQMQLLDAGGRAVWQQQLPAFNGSKEASWPIPGLSKGTYLLKAQSGQRQSVVRVVVE